MKLYKPLIRYDVSIRFWGEFNTREMTQALNIEPTHTKQIDIENSSAKLNAWVLRSPTSEEGSLESQLEWLVAFLGARACALEEFGSGVINRDAVVRCKNASDFLSFSLDRKIIRNLASLDCRLIFMLHNVAKREPNKPTKGT